MRLFLFSLLLICIFHKTYQQGAFIDDPTNDDDFQQFNEAEVFDEEPEAEDGIFVEVEDEETEEFSSNAQEIENEPDSILDEDDHFANEEEFTGFSSEESAFEKPGLKKTEPKITAANLPMHLRSNWDSYILEIFLLLGLVIYLANFNIGRNRNSKMATFWFAANKQILTRNFALVGDDGRAMTLTNPPVDNGPEGPPPAPVVEEPKKTKSTYDILKESENSYTVYCSGRLNVHSMMVELKLVKRHDLFSLALGIFKPTIDEAIIRIRLPQIEPLVMCIASKKFNNKYAKEMNDVTTFCRERKNFNWNSRHLKDTTNWSVWSEIPEVFTDIFVNNPAIGSALASCFSSINYIHITDQFTGAKLSEQEQQSNTAQIAAQKMVIISSRILEDDSETLRKIMSAALLLTDKLADYKLSKEAKSKALKNREKVQKAFMKSVHAHNSERAQELREGKIRQEREDMMEIEDPEKQRRWEKKENKKLAKKKNPKVKQLRVNM